MLLNGGELGGIRILSRKTVELMTAYSDESFFIWEGNDGVRDTHGDRYGFGLGIRTDPRSIDSIGSFSWGGAYHTLFWADPTEQLVGVFMSQLQGPDIREQHRKFKVLAYQAIVD